MGHQRIQHQGFQFYLLSPVREANDEQWGPEWNELLALEPAPAVVMGHDAVDPAQ